MTNDDLRETGLISEENDSLEDLPCRAGHASCRFNRATEDDELHTVDDGIAGDIADEGLNETLECLHEIEKGGKWRGKGWERGKRSKRMYDGEEGTYKGRDGDIRML